MLTLLIVDVPQGVSDNSKLIPRKKKKTYCPNLLYFLPFIPA